MERTCPWSRLPKIVVLLILAFTVLGSQAAAAPITYQTGGHIWPWKYADGASPGFSGPNVISFQGLSTGTISVGEPFPLGQFVLSSPPAGTSTTYNHSAFSIILDTSLGNHPRPASSGYTPFSSVHLYGILDGTISSSGESSVVASILSIEPNTPVTALFEPFNPVLDLPFPLSGLVVDQALTLTPPGEAAGTTMLMARVSAAPEPSSSLVFLLGALALGAGRYRRIGGR